MIGRTSFLLLFYIFAMACSPRSLEPVIQDEAAYLSEMQRWRNERIRLLTAPEGWLSLVGLYWLHPGDNTIGSRSEMDIMLDDPAPPKLGVITLEGRQAYFRSAGEAYVTADGQRFIEGPVHSDTSPEFNKLSYKSLVFYLIERNGRIGLRVKNTLSDKRFMLKEIDHFPDDPAYCVYAKPTTPKEEIQVTVEDITGSTQEYRVEAALEFTLDGKSCSLLAFDGGPDDYFVIFSDLSNHRESYGGGRYMYVPKATAGNGKIILDFNKAFNPPCVFTDYATCPIPPEENRLELYVKAGEKYPVNFTPRRQ